ncbi:MAG: hypothetical protein SP1CHLAM9_11770 [Chlamydiia bacterium]|nr:hypothetical protein [Chlamydiia bacterium]
MNFGNLSSLKSKFALWERKITTGLWEILAQTVRVLNYILTEAQPLAIIRALQKIQMVIVLSSFGTLFLWKIIQVAMDLSPNSPPLALTQGSALRGWQRLSRAKKMFLRQISFKLLLTSFPLFLLLPTQKINLLFMLSPTICVL